jgi:hypothetical protein
VRRAIVIADGKRVGAADVELTEALDAVAPQTSREARESVEREMVQTALNGGGRAVKRSEDVRIGRRRT